MWSISPLEKNIKGKYTAAPPLTLFSKVDNGNQGQRPNMAGVEHGPLKRKEVQE